ncbi:hypothetical protein [Kribbella sp. NPDC023855]|uniref:hypothetical protein n=1 Tax=Kribbella sp. NPDC023855 TaxID=3154698 RepID=UPI0033C3C4ED
MDADDGNTNLTWVHDLIARNPSLAAMRYRVVFRSGLVSVEVIGAYREASTWRAAINGMIRPSWTDVRGLRHHLVIGSRVAVDVVHPADSPRR